MSGNENPFALLLDTEMMQQEDAKQSEELPVKVLPPNRCGPSSVVDYIVTCGGRGVLFTSMQVNSERLCLQPIYQQLLGRCVGL